MWFSQAASQIGDRVFKRVIDLRVGGILMSRCRVPFFILGAVLFIASLPGCASAVFVAANVPTEFAHVERQVNLAYGTDQRQKLDVYMPRMAVNRPVVIFWYGGSWQKGNKSDYRFVGTALAKLGFVAVLPDYRLYPQVTFPAFDEDGARAVAWVEQHVQEFGGDPRRIVLMGHSAGAHTAAFLALNHAFLEKFGASSANIVGLVGLSGPYVLVPDSEALRSAFAAPFSEKDWQPIRFVDSHAPPALLLHGLGDKEVLPQETIELQGALLQQHVRVQMHLFPHRGHADTLAPFAVLVRWRTPVVDEVDAFVRSVSAEIAPAGAAPTP
jgi:acetyl esterase/lipase